MSKQHIVVSIPPSTSQPENVATFEPSEHLGWIIVTAAIAIILNTLVNIFKAANEKNIGDILGERIGAELKPLSQDVSELKNTLSNFSKKLIEIEADRTILKKELDNASNRLEGKIDSKEKSLRASVDQNEKAIGLLQESIKTMEERTQEMRIELAKVSRGG